MIRRLATAIAASWLVLGISAFPASGQSSDVRMTSPQDGSVITDQVTLTLRVDVHPVDEVNLRLSLDGTSVASNTATIPIPCVENCDTGPSTTWGNRTFDPASGAPFAAGLCNGDWTIQGRLDKGQWRNLAEVTLSAPPSAPRNVKVKDDGGTAIVSWTSSKSVDVVGYRVERNSGQRWVVVGEVDENTTAVDDATVSAGTHDYRVVALRPDGMVRGESAPACEDTEADLETASAPVTFSWDTATDDGDPDTGNDGGTNDGSGNGTGNGSGNQNGSGNGTGNDDTGNGGFDDGQGGTNDPNDPDGQGGTNDPDGSVDDDDDEDTGTTRPRNRPRSVAPPPSASRQTDNRVDAPTLNRSGGEDDGFYYGEGDEFAGEIDYGDTEGIPGERIIVGYSESGEPIYETIPGGIVEDEIRLLDASKLRAIAFGLLLVVLALHGRRWMNAEA